jgi:hypothetical protein
MDQLTLYGAQIPRLNRFGYSLSIHEIIRSGRCKKEGVKKDIKNNVVIQKVGEQAVHIIYVFQDSAPLTWAVCIQSHRFESTQ